MFKVVEFPDKQRDGYLYRVGLRGWRMEAREVDAAGIQAGQAEMLYAWDIWWWAVQLVRFLRAVIRVTGGQSE
jgi:hypothetical protein